LDIEAPKGCDMAARAQGTGDVLCQRADIGALGAQRLELEGAGVGLPGLLRAGVGLHRAGVGLLAATCESNRRQLENLDAPGFALHLQTCASQLVEWLAA